MNNIKSERQPKLSYIQAQFSPYRGDTCRECMEILEEDLQWVEDSFEVKGLNFLLAYISVAFLSTLKAILHYFTQMQKPKMTYDHLALTRTIHKDSITNILSRREGLNIKETQNHDNLCPNDNVKTQQADTINKLRSYLYQHDLTLHATTLKKINHKRTEEELLEMYRTGILSKPLSTTHVTFGHDLNLMLKEVLQDTIDLRTDRFSKETYIKVLNDDFMPIKDALCKVYNEKVVIKFD